MKVPLLDLKIQYTQIQEEVEAALIEVIQSQYFIMGPVVERLESEVAEYCGSRHAVGVSSGTDALLLAMMASGVGYGDLVITTPFTFFATVGSVARLGAAPVFVDIDAQTYNMDAELLQAALETMPEEKLRRVKAILPVHLFGQCAAMEPILATAEKYGLPVVEDAAQAIGAEYRFKDGKTKRAGTMGSMGCFSFFPSKNLGAFGDGGMVTTDNGDLQSKLALMRVHGARTKYQHEVVGGNFRLDAIQAAVLRVKLKHLDRWTAGRQRNAALYRKLFPENGLNEIILPAEMEARHIYNQFVIQVPNRRNELKAFLNEKDIGCEIYYPIPMHIQPCFAAFGYQKQDFPKAVEAADKTLALPIYPELTDAQICYVVDNIAQFYR